jgi:nucleolar protein 14
MKNNKKPMPPREKKATRALNPFDIKQNAKIKYKVLGKKVKGQNRNVAAARAQAESKRRKVLSSQFSNRHKSNEFKDKRLGEQDPTMSLEDKMMARFQTERKRKLRNAQLYALGDSDQEDKGDNDLFLTHKGAKIDDFDLLNNDIRTEEDEDDKNVPLDKEIVEKLHFGGGEPSDVKKSHKEIMHEVMMKSKMFKAERQKTKMAQEDATEALDNDFSDILGLLSFRPRKGEPGYGDDKPALDEFDKLTRELAFEAKEQATERRMTPEEVAKREHDKLAELECKRVARMKGAEEYETKDRKSIGKKKPQMVIMPQTDDDLEADYEVDSRYADGLDDDGSEGTISNEDEKVEGKLVDENDEDFIEGDGSDEEEHDSDDEDLEEKELDKEEVEEIPFVLPCPSSTDELQQLFQIYAKVAEDRSTIVQRIITYYSPRLSVDNQQKMKAFMAVLVRLFLKLASNFSKNKLDVSICYSELIFELPVYCIMMLFSWT